MKFFLPLCVVFCLVFLSSASNVVDLIPDNFEQVLDGSKHVFVEFFAPWCGHCKSLAPAYEVVGDAFVKESGAVIAKVDCDANKDICSKYGVSGYPTLKFFKKGSDSPSDYNGGREASDIIDYVNREAGTHARISKPASAVSILGPNNFEEIVKDTSKDVFVEFYAPWCGHCKKLTPIWETLARVFKNDDVVIANLDADQHKELGTKYGVSGFPTLIYFSKTNKDTGERYNGGREINDLISHINKEAGTHRTESGLLDDTVGRHEALDELAKKFFSDADDREKITKEAESVSAKLGDKNFEWYGKFMKIIQKRGEDWLEKEKERTKVLLEGGAVESHKQDEFTVRRNVLNSFVKE